MPFWRPSLVALCVAATATLPLLGCGGGDDAAQSAQEPPVAQAATDPMPQGTAPPNPDPANVYATTGAGMLAPQAEGVPYRLYVPNSESDTVDVIDPDKEEVVRSFAVGGLPQHVVPSHDMKTLYVNSNQGNTLTAIDPATTKPAPNPIPVEDPYNLYFTPDGGSAIVVAERLQRLDFRDTETMKLQDELEVPCEGVNHMDFAADGSYLIASCEFAGAMIKVDLERRKLVETLALPNLDGMPQDVKMSPDGKVFYVADMASNGLWEIDPERFKVIDFLPTGEGAHGLYPSRDGTKMYASNRDEGTISVIDFATREVVDKWAIPGGGSPDMGGVSPDGEMLWLTGRYNSEVYGFDTGSGELSARIPVGAGPHGMAVWPQPGRYSLGHTGNMR